MMGFRYLLLAFLLSSCYYQEEDATLYEVGDNFELCVDSLSLQSNQPLHNMPVDTVCEQISVHYGDPLVVAEMLVIPEDSVDSVWVKLARDQFTMGWVHQRDFQASVVPDDPISQFIHLFSIRHLGVFLVVFLVSLIVLLWQVFGKRKPHVFFLRDILSPYPTYLLITLALSALLYAGIQHYVPETWVLYYYHPTLNPFGLPLILSILCYLLFTLAALSPGVSYILFALFILVLLLRYFRHSRPLFICGACGKRLKELGKCPHCGAENR